MALYGILGVPLLGERVAPRCTCADGLLIANVRSSRVTSQSRIEAQINSGEDLVSALKDCSVDTLVCGGIRRDLREALLAQGIEAIDNVTCTCDELLRALAAGALQPGFGFGKAGDGPALGGASPAPEPAIDCLACKDRGCLVGGDCPAGPVPAGPDLTAVARAMLDATADVALEERQLCRLAELVYFCLGMQYRKVGIAYCSELSEAAQILRAVLSRFFEVSAVCCKVSGAEGRAADLPGDHRAAGCNPLGQATLLNRAGTDLNVIAGLCVGADCLFTTHSAAPVTTLFTKDRMLANNAFAALYSQRYLHESMSGPVWLREAAALEQTRRGSAAGRPVRPGERQTLERSKTEGQ